MSRSSSVELARATARRQLRRVLTLLAILDTSVVALVVGLAVVWARYHPPTPFIVAPVLGGVSAILLTRVALGVRLKRRSGNL
jgi:hypothetical protein